MSAMSAITRSVMSWLDTAAPRVLTSFTRWAGTRSVFRPKMLRLSAARMAQQQGAEALELAQRALALRERMLGPEHPETGMALSDLSEVHWYRGESSLSEQRARRALEVLERALGPDHPALIAPLNALASPRVGQEIALPLLERALRILETRGASDSSHMAVLVNNIGGELGRAGRLPEAERLLTDALARMERQLGPEHPTLVICLYGLADVKQARGRGPEALVHLERAAALQGALADDVRGMWWPTLLKLGQLYLKLDRPQEARVPLARLVEGRPNVPVSPMRGATARFLLADALWRSGERPRAVRLAREARGLVPPTGEGPARLLRDVDAWLARHRP